MDTNKEANKKESYGLISYIKGEISKRRTDKISLLLDLLVFMLSFFFAKRHIAFGVYPLGITIVGVLNSRVLVATLGAVIGALSLGDIGLVYALMIPLVVVIRLILSFGKESGVFCEDYVIRVFSVAISSSLVSLYELLISGPTLNATLFASVGILLSVGIAISLFGAFTTDITYKDIIFSSPLAIKRDGEFIPSRVFYHASVLFLILLSTLSFDGYSFFGITLSYIFLSAITIFTATRFGIARGMLVGFFGGLTLGAITAVGFALAGLVVALLSRIGVGYAIIGSTIAIGIWSGYALGISGFLSVFPEYGITATLMLPFMRYNATNKTDVPEGRVVESPHLSLILERIKGSYGMEFAERMRTLSSSLARFSTSSGTLEFSEYRNIILALTSEMTPTPCEEIIDALASKFYKGERLKRADIVKVLGKGSEKIAEKILRLTAEYEQECFMNAGNTGLVGEYERLIKQISFARMNGDRAIAEDKALTKILTGILRNFKIEYDSATVVGEYEKQIIIIAREEFFGVLSDEKLHTALSGRLGRCLAHIKCERSYGVAVFTSKISPLFMVEYGIRTRGGENSSVSGDSARVITNENSFYSFLSDGVGRGKGALEISSFITDYLESSIGDIDVGVETIISSLSSILRTSRNEASGTADIISANLYTGKGYFIKCGAVSSYIIRNGEIIELKGGGAPLGLAHTPIFERELIEINYDDMIVMVSDGAMQSGDDAYLKELIKRTKPSSAEEYATSLFNNVISTNSPDDDITVLAIKILPFAKKT